MRVSCSLWRVVLYFEARKTYLDREESGSWSRDWKGADARRRDGLEIIGFWKQIISANYGLTDVETVVEWMFPEAIGTYESVAWSEPLSHSLVLSRCRHGSVCCSASNEPTTSDEWTEAENAIHIFGSSAFGFVSNFMLNYPLSPLRGLDFAVFRP